MVTDGTVAGASDDGVHADRIRRANAARALVDTAGNVHEDGDAGLGAIGLGPDAFYSDGRSSPLPPSPAPSSPSRSPPDPPACEPLVPQTHIAFHRCPTPP